MTDHWSAAIPDTLTVEHQGAQVPLRDVPFVKETPDIPTLAKRAYDAHTEVGARLPLKVTKPEEVAAWRKEHLPKLYKAGILEAPPESPDAYGELKPAEIPAGMQWNPEIGKELAATLHKYGVPKGAAQELVGLHMKAIGALYPNPQDAEKINAALHEEFKDDFDQRVEDAKRMAEKVMSPEDAQQVIQGGFKDHLAVMRVLMRLAPLAAQDSSFLAGGRQGGGALTPEQAEREAKQLMADPALGYLNRDHPKHAETTARVRELFTIASKGQMYVPR